MTIDPVCKKEVEESQAAGQKAMYLGRTYYFCSPSCRSAFYRDPHAYAAKGEENAEVNPAQFLVADM